MKTFTSLGANCVGRVKDYLVLFLLTCVLGQDSCDSTTDLVEVRTGHHLAAFST